MALRVRKPIVMGAEAAMMVRFLAISATTISVRPVSDRRA